MFKFYQNVLICNYTISYDLFCKFFFPKNFNFIFLLMMQDRTPHTKVTMICVNKLYILSKYNNNKKALNLSCQPRKVLETVEHQMLCSGWPHQDKNSAQGIRKLQTTHFLFVKNDPMPTILVYIIIITPIKTVPYSHRILYILHVISYYFK